MGGRGVDERAIIQQVLSTPCAGDCVRMKSEGFEEFQDNRHILHVIIDNNKKRFPRKA